MTSLAMINPDRGEVELKLPDQSYSLVLTLDALARLEHHFQSDGLRGLLNLLASKPSGATIAAVLQVTLCAGGLDRDSAHLVLAVQHTARAQIEAYTDLIAATFAALREIEA